MATKQKRMHRTHERHGKRNLPEYQIWLTMKQRCHNPRSQKYQFYGALGIRVCTRWRKSFSAFMEDMGPRLPGMTLDRRNPCGNYSPENCRWATWKEQRRNKRNNVWVTHDGKRQILADWAEETGIAIGTLRARLFQYGWSPARALTQPPSMRVRSTNRMLTFRGKTQPAVVWAEEIGIPYQTLKTRLNKMQWSTEKALTTPVRRHSS